MKKRYTGGFTLLEMSIVLLIIAFIAGGILVGKTILTNSRLQTVMTDADNYMTAAANFRQTYQALPGDMATATTLWGTDSGCAGGTTGTCNGNGDGRIGGTAGQAYESFRFWQHLYYAGMFNQKLNGVAGSGGTYASAAGVNIPGGSMQGSGYYVAWWGTVTSDTDRFAGFYGDVLQFGRVINNNLPYGAILSPAQASAIDSKIDDGYPSTGKVRTYGAGTGATINPSCATTGDSTAVYNVSNANPQCSLVFVTGF